jgi:hypothetical protein
MKRHRAGGVCILLFLGTAVAVVGCQAQAGIGVEPDIGGCGQDSTVDCSGGGWGYSCAAGDNPENEDSSLSCSIPTPDPNGNDDYCCFTWSPSGGGSTCTPDDSLTSACPGPDSYGYVCADPSDDPTSLDPSLNCSQGVPDADGTSTDFCCNYGEPYGGSSGGVVYPTGCSADPTVDCSGSGADGYSCASGDNPEAEDPSLSCSDPTPDGSGNDAYCCFSWSYGTSSCTPDDGLTSACPDPTSYGYRCADPNDDPTSLDPSLTCSAGVPDPDGTDTDFCCTYQ